MVQEKPSLPVTDTSQPELSCVLVNTWKHVLVNTVTILQIYKSYFSNSLKICCKPLLLPPEWGWPQLPSALGSGGTFIVTEYPCSPSHFLAACYQVGLETWLLVAMWEERICVTSWPKRFRSFGSLSQLWKPHAEVSEHLPALGPEQSYMLSHVRCTAQVRDTSSDS